MSKGKVQTNHAAAVPVTVCVKLAIVRSVLFLFWTGSKEQLNMLIKVLQEEQLLFKFVVLQQQILTLKKDFVTIRKLGPYSCRVVFFANVNVDGFIFIYDVGNRFICLSHLLQKRKVRDVRAHMIDNSILVLELTNYLILSSIVSALLVSQLVHRSSIRS